MDLTKSTIFISSVFMLSLQLCTTDKDANENKAQRPNFLFIISDDQGYLHAGAYGSKDLRTPEFDKLAREGMLFKNAYCAAPNCSPSRAAILTGMNIWQLEEAALLYSTFPAKFKVLPDILEENGYYVGFCGKGWSPGNWKVSGRKRNPAGNEFSKFKLDSLPGLFIGTEDPAKNFDDFISRKKKDQPFMFWYGSYEPHVGYEKGIGLRNGIDTSKLTVPAFMPNVADAKLEISDYLFEIEWFDKQVGRLIESLKQHGLDENTLIIVTSDNGIVNPHGKRSLFEWGTHEPFALYWPKMLNKGKAVDRLTSFTDIAPTFLELAGIELPKEMVGKSFAGLVLEDLETQQKDFPDFVLTGFERHDPRRFDNVGYPMRAIRTKKYLYIRNYKPDRWPEGDPVANEYGKKISADDIYFRKNEKGEYISQDPFKSSWTYKYTYLKPGTKLFNLAFGKRPSEELYDIIADPDCMNNILKAGEYKQIADSLYQILQNILITQGDPRECGYGDIFDSYPYYGTIPFFKATGGFQEYGQYNPKYHVHPLN